MAVPDAANLPTEIQLSWYKNGPKGSGMQRTSSDGSTLSVVSFTVIALNQQSSSRSEGKFSDHLAYFSLEWLLVTAMAASSTNL